MGIEIELKLAVAAKDHARLRRSPLLKGKRPEKQQLYTVYFDTPDFELMQRGIAWRLRRVGYHWVQTVKVASRSTGTLSRRGEWEVQVTGNLPDLAVLPEEARVQVAEFANRLQPCFETAFERSLWHLRPAGEPGSECLVEVALDRGEVRAGDRVETLSELELELKEGQPLALFGLADALLEAAPMTLEPRSKAQRGYTLAGALTPRPLKYSRPPLTADLPARLAWQRLIGACLVQFSGNLNGVLAAEAEVEYVHQLRVALRRLLAFASLAKWLADGKGGTRDGETRPAWFAEIKWLLGEIGPARDWDVFAHETLPRVRAALAGSDRLAPLEAAMQGVREGAHARARTALSSARALRAILAVEAELVDAGQQPPDGKGQHTGAWARKVLRRRHASLLQAGHAFEQMTAPERHRLRIAAKRMRYAVDGFFPLHEGKALQSFQADMSTLQDILGVANDVVVAQQLLGELGSDPELSRACGFIEGFLVAERQAGESALQERVGQLLATPPYWKPAK